MRQEHRRALTPPHPGREQGARVAAEVVEAADLVAVVLSALSAPTVFIEVLCILCFCNGKSVKIVLVLFRQ